MPRGIAMNCNCRCIPFQSRDIHDKATQQLIILRLLCKTIKKRQFTITTATFNWEWPLSVSVSIRNLCMYSGCSRRNVSRLCDSLCQLPRMSHVKSVLSISLCNDHPLQSVHDCPRICWCRFLHSCIGTMRRFQTSTNCQCIP